MIANSDLGMGATEPWSWFVGSEHQPNPVPVEFRDRLPGVEFTLYEWTDYHLTIPGAVKLRIGSRLYTPVALTDTFIVNIGNRLGTVALTPIYTDATGITVHAEVVARKFATLRESLDFSQAIVDQLSARIRTMPFVVQAETSRQVIREHREPNLFFIFHYLRYHGDGLIRALSITTLDPHRRLGDLVENLRIHETRRIDAEAIHSLLMGPRAGRPNPDPQAPAIERLQPLRITQRRPEETYDTPENRFVVAACQRLRLMMERIQAAWWWRDVTDDDIRIFTELDRAIRILLQSDRFRGLEGNLRLPAYSRVLQMKPGYRELTIFWSSITQVHVSVLTRLSKAIDLRDVPTLYEYWQFFELAEAIGRHVEQAPVYRTQVDPYPKNWGLEAAFPGIGKLSTQRSFGGAQTYTPVSFRPDFVWESESGEMIALDAKFAMDSLNDFQEDEDSLPAYKASSRDITKMHGYRDAIQEMKAALVVFPGTVGAFWGVDGSTRSLARIDEVVEAIVNCDLEGIGAVPMSPRMQGEE